MAKSDMAVTATKKTGPDMSAVPPAPAETSIEKTGTANELPTSQVPEELLGASAGGTPVSHTVDELPGLVNYKEGDDITFRVMKVSDDGKTYDLEFLSEPEGAMSTPQGGSSMV
jgi:hypothetical protein